MTDEELSALEALEEWATPGPWRTGRKVHRTLYDSAEGGEGSLIGVMDDPRDAAFVAAARTDIPALIAEVRRLRAAVAEEREACAKLVSRWHISKGGFTELAHVIRARGGK